MENQCSVKYIFQLFESRTVLQPILANSTPEGLERSHSTARGLDRKVKGPFMAALLPGTGLNGEGWARLKCGGELSIPLHLSSP